MFSQLFVFAFMATSVFTTPLRRIDINCPVVNKASVPFNFSSHDVPTPGSDTNGFCVYASEAPCHYELDHGLPTNFSDPHDCPFAISNLNDLSFLAGCPFVNGVNAPLLQGFVSNIRTTVCTYATRDISVDSICTYGTGDAALIPASSGDDCLPALPPVLNP
ncbi:hypothetical protein C8R47DRAFT_1313112 [Mycena vitilis]|nr:hypothetical protein C8R47DRAFT_1313112 [Mycena vitilis]